MIPKLNQLLEHQTTILLGAGASKDYGFPLWGELKMDLLQELPQCSGIIRNTKAIDWWRDALGSMDGNDTIDIIATNAPEEYFDAFRILLSLVICNYENRDLQSKNVGWIEKFAEKFFRLLRTTYPDREKVQVLLQNLNIVTLNYDRALDYRFYGSVEKNLQSILTKPREFLKFYQQFFTQHCQVYHPHGCLGNSASNEFSPPSALTYLNPNTMWGVDYGNTGDLRRNISNGNFPPVLPVDDLKDAENRTYNLANQILQKSKYAICIGLSQSGIKNSALELSKIDKVYYSGDIKVEDNFEPLNLWASEIVDLL